MLGVDVIVMSQTTSTFNMADANIWERDSLMATPMFKSNAGDQKRFYHSCLVQLEKSVPRNHGMASLGKAL